MPGPYHTSRGVILGEGGFPALQLDKNQFPNAPSKVLAAVYFPTDTVIPTPTHFSGKLPLTAVLPVPASALRPRDSYRHERVWSFAEPGLHEIDHDPATSPPMAVSVSPLT